MANVIKLHKGLNINLKGKAAQEIFTVNAPDTYALVPDDFHGVTPKVVVKENKIQPAVMHSSFKQICRRQVYRRRSLYQFLTLKESLLHLVILLTARPSG